MPFGDLELGFCIYRALKGLRADHFACPNTWSYLSLMTSLKCAEAMAGLPQYEVITMGPAFDIVPAVSISRLHMQDVTAMGLVSMAVASLLRMEPTSATVREDGMVKNAMFQVGFCVMIHVTSDSLLLLLHELMAVVMSESPGLVISLTAIDHV